MSDVTNSPNMIKLPVSKLALGMFVTAIDKNNSSIAIGNAGQIKSRDAIVKLKKNNIDFVWVDIERSAEGCGLKKIAQQEVPGKPLAKKALATREVKQAQAKQILDEAKGLVKKVLSETFEGKAVEVAPFEAVADKMIESVMDDADALKCISALRTKDAY